MRRILFVLGLAAALQAGGLRIVRADDAPWPIERAKAWQESKPWLVGCNFNPSTAINQLEMWQADTFDLKTIDRELGWAEDLGFTSVRVFLHHLLWEDDKDGFLKRMDQFLGVAAKHKIGVMFVVFDAVWDPYPKLGPQHAPVPHRHNSGWVQSPGVEILKDPSRYGTLKPYVQGVIGHFKGDSRIDAWDLFNEPDNRNVPSYNKHEPVNKRDLALKLLTEEFSWAREVDPSQPLTAGVWVGDWSEKKLSAIARFMLEHSDIITFHNYGDLDDLKSRVEALRRYGRPLVCTEYMARPNGSTFDPMLGYFKSQHIGAYNWGFVAGKTQTIYPWDTWTKKYDAEPKVWFHDIFRADGTPFDPREVSYIKSMTGKTPAK